MKTIVVLLFVATMAMGITAGRGGGRPGRGRPGGGQGGGHSGRRPNIADLCATAAASCQSGTNFRFFEGPCDQLPTPSGRPGPTRDRRENPCNAGTDEVKKVK